MKVEGNNKERRRLEVEDQGDRKWTEEPQKKKIYVRGITFAVDETVIPLQNVTKCSTSRFVSDIQPFSHKEQNLLLSMQYRHTFWHTRNFTAQKNVRIRLVKLFAFTVRKWVQCTIQYSTILVNLWTSILNHVSDKQHRRGEGNINSIAEDDGKKLARIQVSCLCEFVCASEEERRR